MYDSVLSAIVTILEPFVTGLQPGKKLMSECKSAHQLLHWGSLTMKKVSAELKQWGNLYLCSGTRQNITNSMGPCSD